MATPDITPRIRWDVFRRDGYRCVGCSSVHDLTVDHMVPRSRGGGHDDDNLQTLCRSCNSRKGVTPREMTPEQQAIAEQLRAAGERRATAEQLRKKAGATLDVEVPRAVEAGIPIAEIARLSHMTRQAIYDLLRKS